MRQAKGFFFYREDGIFSFWVIGGKSLAEFLTGDNREGGSSLQR